MKLRAYHGVIIGFVSLFLNAACSFEIGSGLRPHFGRPERNIGINFFTSQLDYAEDRLFADVMKSAREWVAAGSYGDGSSVNIDSNGWPTTDAEIIVWHGLSMMNGTYYLEGESSSQPTITTGFGSAKIQNFRYANGRFSSNLVYSSTDGSGLLLTFVNTGGGVRNVKLMRPLAPGSSTPYPTTAMFTDQAKAMVEQFNVVRFMWSVDGWNGPWQVEWSDRVKPTYCSYNRGANSTIRGTNIGWAGKGMPWEAAIQFCNETGKDMWLNMPIGASDDYIRRLAELVRDTYTVSDGKVYWEYSNEATWDYTGICSAYLQSKARAEASARGPIAYDSESDESILTARYYAKRAAEMSAIWRSVWGDEDMMTRVRPIASGQLTYNLELAYGLDFVHSWFNNGQGNHVATPHPVSYYFYGSGASHYTGDNPDAISGGVSEIAEFETYEEEEACHSKIYGLRRAAYEGGVWTNAQNYLLPRIWTAMVRYHDLWDEYDGDLLTYYVTTGGEENGTALGFTQSVFNLDTPKYRGLDDILAKVKPEASAGKLAPCVIDGADYSMSSVPWQHPAAGGAETRGDTELNEWQPFRGYLFRTAEAGQHTVELDFGQASGADIEIMVDGAVITRTNISGVRSSSYAFSLNAGLHGLRVKKCNSGSLFLKSVSIK